MRVPEALVALEQFDRIARDLLPTLTPGEQAIVVQIFARSMESGACKIPGRELAQYTGLAESGVSKMVAALTQHGTLSVRRSSGSSRRTPNEYAITFPLVLGPTNNGRKRFEKKGVPVAVRPTPARDAPPTLLIDRFTKKGLAEVERVYASLPEDEKRRYRIEASKTLSPGADMERTIRELVARSFGPSRIKEYMEDHD